MTDLGLCVNMPISFDDRQKEWGAVKTPQIRGFSIPDRGKLFFMQCGLAA